MEQDIKYETKEIIQVVNFDNYRELTSFFNSYPANDRVLCACMGLYSESGEIVGKFDKLIRDSNKQFNETNKQEIVKEIGDCFWYLSELCNLKNIYFNTKFYTDFSIFNGKSVFDVAIGLRYPVKFLIDSVIEHSDHINPDLAGRLYLHLNMLLKMMGISLQQCLQVNINKLTDRYNRNKINGAGDNR